MGSNGPKKTSLKNVDDALNTTSEQNRFAFRELFHANSRTSRNRYRWLQLQSWEESGRDRARKEGRKQRRELGRTLSDTRTVPNCEMAANLL